MQIASLYGSIGVNITPKTWQNLAALERKFLKLRDTLQDINKEKRRVLNFNQANTRGIRSATTDAHKLVKKLERIKQLKDTRVKVVSTFQERQDRRGAGGRQEPRGGSGVDGDSRDRRRFPLAISGGGGGQSNFWDYLFKGTLAGAAIGSIYQIPMNIDKLVAGIQAQTGNQTKTQEMIGLLKTTANEMGLKISDVSDSFVRQYASVKESGYDDETFKKIFKGFSSASLIYGLTGPDQDRMFKAVSQMISKGQVMSEELKQQLGDVLPGAIGAFARSRGVSVGEFLKLVEKGDIKTPEIIQVAEDYMRSAEGIMDLRNKQIASNLNRLSNSWMEFWARVFTSDLYEKSVEFIKELTTLLNKPETAKAFGQALSEGLDRVITLIKKLNDYLTGVEKDSKFEEKLEAWRKILFALTLVMISDNPLKGFISGVDKLDKKIGNGYLGKLIDLGTFGVKAGLADMLWSKKGESTTEVSAAFLDKIMSSGGPNQLLLKGVSKLVDYELDFLNPDVGSIGAYTGKHPWSNLKYGENPYANPTSQNSNHSITNYIEKVEVSEGSVAEDVLDIFGIDVKSISSGVAK